MKVVHNTISSNSPLLKLLMDLYSLHFCTYRYLAHARVEITLYYKYLSESPYFPLQFPLFTLHKLLIFEKLSRNEKHSQYGVFLRAGEEG
jgi:hypothetical protein